jgi:hypothetical protein
MADHLVLLPTDLYPVAPCDAPEQQPDQLQLLTNIIQQLAAHVETLSVAAAPTKHTPSTIPTADFDRAAGGRRELDALPVDSTNTPLEYIDPREWSDFASRTFADCLPPSGTTLPCLWNPRHDEADNFLRTTREYPPATSIDTCYAMVYLRPPLTRHLKMLWK